MKRLLAIAATLGFALFVFSWTASAQQTQQQDQQPQSQSDSTQQQQQPVNTPSARTFEGKIAKAGGKLVLQDSATTQAYLLDDQDKAKQFVGKNVEVMGTLDPDTNTVHVVDIMVTEK
jgi:hypothetical protein